MRMSNFKGIYILHKIFAILLELEIDTKYHFPTDFMGIQIISQQSPLQY